MPNKDSFEELVQPRPEDQVYKAPKPVLPSPAASLEIIAAAFKAISWSTYTRASELKDGLKHAQGVYRDYAERILSTYVLGKDPAELDVETDAALTHTGIPTEPVYAYLLARGDFAYAIRVMVRSAYLQGPSVGGQSGSYRYFEATQPSIDKYVALDGFATYLARMRPALGEKDIAEARAEATKARTEPLPVRIALALAFDDAKWMAADATLVLAMKKNEYHYSVPRIVFRALRDVELVTKLAQRHPTDVPADDLLDALGLAASEAVIASFEKDPKSDYNARSLARVESVAAAKALAPALGTKRAAEVARAYYEARPDLAIVALAPIVARGDKIAPYVKPVLDAIVRKHKELPEKLAEHLDAKSRALFDSAAAAAADALPEAKAKEIPTVLSAPPAAPRKGKARELPPFVDVTSMPKVALAGGKKALPDDAAKNLLAILQRSTLDEPHAALGEVKKACDAASLSAFVWALFEAWLASGTGSKENWAFTALGLLGDDEAARRLTPLIRTWPGESQHARAGVGLDVLAGIGTDLALMHLHGVAEKVKFKGLQERAKEKIGIIAAARGLTAEELGDRLVPVLGLDDDGSLALDFGARSFKVGFDEALRPKVKDESGKTLTDLPKPGKSDDAEKAAESIERWKNLKKDARTVAASQLTRLELAMCSQRRWKAPDFQTFIVRHPLVVHIARRLVWATFDATKVKATFRVTEDGTLADEADKTFALPKDAIVGLVHRLELSDALAAKWGSLLAEYEILQPFEQLGREVFLPTPAEKTASVLDRLGKLSVKTGKVMGLEIRGWRKGPPQDAGWVYEMNKLLPGGIEASFGLDGGLCMGSPDMNPSMQGVEGISLARIDGGKATFAQLSPTVFSELVRELQSLRE